MAKKGGIQAYTVQEAQNISMGQAGTVFIDDNDLSTYTPPTGAVVVAIQAIDDCVFTTNTTSESTNYASPAAGAASGGSAMGTMTIPSGMTIYGRFATVDFSGTPKAILYLG